MTTFAALPQQHCISRQLPYSVRFVLPKPFCFFWWKVDYRSTCDKPRTSSASQHGGEQTQKVVEGRGCTHQNVEGFFPKYFEGKSWTERTRSTRLCKKDMRTDSGQISLSHRYKMLSVNGGFIFEIKLSKVLGYFNLTFFTCKSLPNKRTKSCQP